MSRRRTRPDAGFALVEALVVLFVSALVMVTLTTAVGMMARTWGRTTQEANAVEGLASGLAALRRDLAGAERFYDGRQKGTLLFAGSERKVGFAVDQDGTAPGPGMSLVTIEVRQDGNRRSLVRSAAALTPASTGLAGARFENPVVLMSGPWTFRFGYGAPDDTGLAWSDRWTASGDLPEAVRLEILDARGGGAVVPPLIVPLRINGTAGCGPAGCETEPADAQPADDQTESGQDGGSQDNSGPDGGATDPQGAQ